MDYDDGAEILKAAITKMLEGGFPKEELPPLLADFTFMTALAAAGTSGVAAMLCRIRRQMELAEQGQYQGHHELSADVLTLRVTEAISHEFDGSPIRVAMEHLISHQALPLDQAAACFTIYALMLVFDRTGANRAKALVRTADRELQRLNTESTFVNASGDSAYAI